MKKEGITIKFNLGIKVKIGFSEKKKTSVNIAIPIYGYSVHILYRLINRVIVTKLIAIMMSTYVRKLLKSSIKKALTRAACISGTCLL